MDYFHPYSCLLLFLFLSSPFLHVRSAAIPVSQPVEQWHWGIQLPVEQKTHKGMMSVLWQCRFPLATQLVPWLQVSDITMGTWGQWDSGSGSAPDIWASWWAHRKLVFTPGPLAAWQGHSSPYKERNQCLNAPGWHRRRHHLTHCEGMTVTSVHDGKPLQRKGLLSNTLS